MTCKIKYQVNRQDVINKLVNTAYSTFPSLEAQKIIIIKCMEEEYAFPYIQRLNGLIAESLGRNSDGGIIPLTSFKNYEYAFTTLLKHLLDSSAAVTMTIRPWSPMAKIEKNIVSEANVDFSRTYLYPRLLILNTPFESYIQKISKKARNRYKYFRKHGGQVETANPLKYIREILQINYSSPTRQGRPLPPSYMKPNIVKETLKQWKKYIDIGIASFFITKLNNSIVGYSFVPHLNQHAYISRFLVHKEYMKYGVGNALLLEIIKYLKENKKAKIVQYGYWRNINPGVNHFLQQHLFRRGIEEYKIYIKNNRLLKYLIRKNVEVTNNLKTGKLRVIQDKLLMKHLS